MTTFKEQIDTLKNINDKISDNQAEFVAQKFGLTLSDAKDALNGVASNEILNTEYHPPIKDKCGSRKSGYRRYTH